MKKLLMLLFVVLTLSCCVVSGQEKAGETGQFSIMTWNINNLFDGNDDGNEYAEFLQSSGWSDEKYKGRLNSISAAIGTLSSLPDIIILQEVESLLVMEGLSNSLPRGYSWSHFANNPGSAIGLGILSRHPLLETRAHSVTIGEDTSPRPVLEARVNVRDEEIVIFANHWKSKIGGEVETENARRASARTILRRCREIREEEKHTGIIIAGDLNINHDDFFRRGMNQICALLPDDLRSVKLLDSLSITEQKDFIVINGNKPPLPVNFPKETIVFYSPWMNELENGSYYYKGNWETIDHFLVCGEFFNDAGWEYRKTIIIDFEPFAGSGLVPVQYNPRTGNGLSDHFPLLLTLFFSGGGGFSIQ